jgi:hypothetical protein
MFDSVPITRILNTYPKSFFQYLDENFHTAFKEALHVTQPYYGEPEQVAMLGQARHAKCEQGFRAAARDSGLEAAVLHTKPAGGVTAW